MTILYLPYLKITLQPLEESRACEHVRCQDNGEEDDPGVVLREASAQAHHRRLSSFRQPPAAARNPHLRSSSQVGGASSAAKKNLRINTRMCMREVQSERVNIFKTYIHIRNAFEKNLKKIDVLDKLICFPPVKSKIFNHIEI